VGITSDQQEFTEMIHAISVAVLCSDFPTVFRLYRAWYHDVYFNIFILTSKHCRANSAKAIFSKEQARKAKLTNVSAQIRYNFCAPARNFIYDTCPFEGNWE
jgi:hypothetical protein